jgi:hypothetical protein
MHGTMNVKFYFLVEVQFYFIAKYRHNRIHVIVTCINYKIINIWYLCIIIIIIVIIIIGIQPLCRSGQRPELSKATGMALVRCILGKFLGVVCHCFHLCNIRA